jgi:predicted acylesterase/phospholipase RssA
MFESVVFAGGGHRCWWQAGWWETVAPRVDLAPKRIAAVSAGAATACLVFANESDTALAYYREKLGFDAKNAYWNRWREGRSAVFPHEGIYRAALKELLGGDRFTRLQRDAPEIRVAFARPPTGVPATASLALGLMAYNLEKYIRRPLHPAAGKKIGFRGEYRTIQSCVSEQELIDLIIASSCTPPFTAVQYQGGEVTIDGGLVDNVPVESLDDVENSGSSRTLVLLTRRYPKHGDVFEVGERVYVQPTRKVAATPWDYTDPESYENTYKQGLEDAQVFLKWVDGSA